MKECQAGHSRVIFWAARCPVCAAVLTLDKALLKADAKIDALEADIAALKFQKQALDWNGGAS